MKGRQPTLFDVPKDSPSKQERIDAFKKLHGIWTYRTDGMKREEHPWLVIALTHAREALKGYGVTEKDDGFEIFASYCRLIEEAGLMVTGEGEVSAIRELCQKINIPCDL